MKHRIEVPNIVVSTLIFDKIHGENSNTVNIGFTGGITDAVYYYVEDGRVTWSNLNSEFKDKVLVDISWQEFVYGEGDFYRWINDNSGINFYLSKRDSKFHWIGNHYPRSFPNEYLNLSEVAYKCDQFGNKLEEKIMESEFTKSDLEIGMVVFHRGYMETPYLVQEDRNGEMFLKGFTSGFNLLTWWGEDLTYFLDGLDGEGRYWDIMKVMFNNELSGVGGTLVDKRVEPQKMTIEEICLELCREVEVVSEH